MPSKEKKISNLNLIHQLKNTLKNVCKVNINTHSLSDVIQGEKFLQSVLDGIKDPIKIVDRDFNIVFLNEMAVKRTGNT